MATARIRMRLLLAGGLVGLVVAGCGEPTLCTLIAGESGVTVMVDRGHLADAVRKVEVEFVRAKTSFVTARVTTLPTDGRVVASLPIPSLEDERVDLAVVLRDAAGAELLRRTTSATPIVRYPNGRGCPPRQISVGLRISARGTVTADPAG
jgi:hypothetical protein